MKRFLWPAVLGSIALVTMGHAVVSPRDSRPGAYERYVLRVPNESDVPTTRVEMTFPANVRVISFVDVPGWQLTAVMDTNSGRAISAVWTGSLPPARFVELPFMGVNPDSATRIVWPVKQTYANGEVVEWSGPEGSNRPASVTVVGTTPRPASTRTWLSVVGIALSVIAIVLALRSRQG